MGRGRPCWSGVLGVGSWGVSRQAQRDRRRQDRGGGGHPAVRRTRRELPARSRALRRQVRGAAGCRRVCHAEGPAGGRPGIDAAFIKGGLVGSLQGRLATEKAQGRYAEFSQLLSVGRLFYEPIWVFTRGDLPITSLRDLKGKKILTGTREGGTRRIANQMLKANGIDKTNATLIAESLPADAAPLLDGSADAAFLIEPPDSKRIQDLLRVKDIRLMDFSEEAEAYDNRFPAIAKVVLRRARWSSTRSFPPRTSRCSPRPSSWWCQRTCTRRWSAC